MEQTVPRIVNIPPLPEEFDSAGRPRLRGLHITDPETIGHGLLAFGVEASALPDWTIYSGTPEHPLGENELALDVSSIATMVESHASRKKVANIEMFKRKIGAVLFTELYRNSPMRTNLIEKTVQEHRSHGFEVALLASMATVYAFGAYGPAGAIPTGLLATGVLARQEIWSLCYKTNRANLKQMNQIKADNPGLEKQLADVTLPVYFGG